MDNLEQFISKLNRINWIGTDTLGEYLVSEDGFKISYTTKLQGLIGSGDDVRFVGLPVQLIFRITKDDVYIQSWGCSEESDTIELAKWYQTTVCKVQQEQRRKERVKEETNKYIWDNY